LIIQTGLRRWRLLEKAKEGRKEEQSMKHRCLWAGALALAVTVCSPVKTLSQVILILTRRDQDQSWIAGGANDTNDPRGPGSIAPGDADMYNLLADNGYSCRLTLNANLAPADFSNWQTVSQDIAGTNGIIARTLDISHAPQVAFLRVQPVP